MKCQPAFYHEKESKNAKDRGQSYTTIKNSINRCNEIGKEFMQKAQRAISVRSYSEAIEYLTFAVKNMPVSFDINKFTKIATSDKDNISYLEKMQELFKDGVVDPFEDDVLKELVTNSKLLGDLEL